MPGSREGPEELQNVRPHHNQGWISDSNIHDVVEMHHSDAALALATRERIDNHGCRSENNDLYPAGISQNDGAFDLRGTGVKRDIHAAVRALTYSTAVQP